MLLKCCGCWLHLFTASRVLTHVLLCCVTRRAGCPGADARVLHAIFSSYVQTHGAAHGTLWDPHDMRPLADSAAMAAALQVG